MVPYWIKMIRGNMMTANLKDAHSLTITDGTKLDPENALALADVIRQKVQDMHKVEANKKPNENGNTRAYKLEEGDVAMVTEPGSSSVSPRVFFLDYRDTDAGSVTRMHQHTDGLHSVSVVTGPSSSMTISSLSPLQLRETDIAMTTDTLPDTNVIRYNYEIPENRLATVEIPSGTSHQFRGHGEYARGISTHIKDPIGKDMPQTIFLQALQENGADREILQKLSALVSEQNKAGYLTAIQAAEKIGADEPLRLNEIMRKMADEKHPGVERKKTVGNATTVLIHERELNELKDRYR
jgi:hypothetical protein